MTPPPFPSETFNPLAQLPRLAAFGLLAALMVAPLAACQRVLFPKDAPRTQYQTFDRMRNRDVPTEKPDVFGRPQPALRERLTPPV